jgi:oxygen-independent coproporphyrinogen-3 oxidase
MTDSTSFQQPLNVFETDRQKVSKRALYFHIPFCETICSFCPFVRGKFRSYEVVEKYMEALTREIQLKSAIGNISNVPIGSIFIGGGTPSILKPKEILAFGKVLRNHFDLSQIEEFSCEFEVKSINEEKAEAFREIGVTHSRFGLQSFLPKYRSLFSLTASLDQVYKAIDLLVQKFPYVSYDLLYGMNGQSEEEFLYDIEKAVETGVKNIDFYPINNLMTQSKLHHSYHELGLEPTSGLTKHYMNLVLRECMREYGYLPHNGHGFVKVESSEAHQDVVLTNSYSFKYHEYVYGYADCELVGFGVNAISVVNGYSIFNTPSRDQYISDLTKKGIWHFTIGKHHSYADNSKPVIVRLPYHGEVCKDLINWQDVHPETLCALSELVDAGLVSEFHDSYKITLTGWYWYVNMMYYLSPRHEKRKIDRFIYDRVRQGNRLIEETKTGAY